VLVLVLVLVILLVLLLVVVLRPRLGIGGMARMKDGNDKSFSHTTRKAAEDDDHD
jgi:preprotein translocase subunit SecG